MTDDRCAADIWADDLLGRRDDAKLLQKFLTQKVADLRRRGKTACYTLNIDAAWGQGKSFFVDRFRRQLEADGSRVAVINAWAEDYVDDPFLGVMAEVLKAVKPERSPAAQKTLKTVAASTGKVVSVLGKHASRAALTRIFGEDGAELAATLGDELAKGGFETLADLSEATSARLGNTLIKQFEESRRTIKHFKAELAKLITVGDKIDPLFVLIDELDRCRPSHAITMLERIKHLFDIEGMIFVVTTDSDQLRHAVNAIYGPEFDSRGYLLRFFDRTYRFPKPERTNYVAQLFRMHGIDTTKLRSPPYDTEHEKFFTNVSEAFDLSLREIERACDMLESFVTLWDKKFRIVMPYLLPLLISAMRGDARLFEVMSKDTALPEDVSNRFKRTTVITFARNDHFGRRQQSEVIDLEDLINAVLQHRNNYLPEIARKQDGDPSTDWAASCYEEEFLRGHGNSFSGKGPKSILNDYPAMVGGVGRLTLREP